MAGATATIIPIDTGHQSLNQINNAACVAPPILPGMDTPATLASIHSAHWQPRLHVSAQVVEGWADIDQAIRIILTTPKGTDRHRPDFGFGGSDYLDWPVDRAVPHLVREAITAIRLWEKRADIIKIDVKVDGHHIALRVIWQAADGVLRDSEVTYEATPEGRR